MTRLASLTLAMAATLSVATASAQTSSLGAQKREADASKPKPRIAREAVTKPRNAVYEQYSWITIRPTPPKTFQPGNLLTVIVRHRKQYDADAELKTKKELKLRSELDAFIKITGGGVGATNFRRGQPNAAYRYSNELKGDADSSRSDRLTTRLTATIIDVKPNGTLVFEGRSILDHDEESAIVTITGICRKEDVTADNTILSTQVADLVIDVENRGALRAATTRGWLSKALDYLKPF